MCHVFEIMLTGDAVMRPLEPWRAEEFFDHIERARAHIAPWVPIPHRVVDVASARTVLQDLADRQARDAGRAVGIWRVGVLVGGVVFAHFDAGAGTCEIGVWLEPSAEGRGIVTAACTRMIDWAVIERGIVRVEWHTNPRNARSRALAARLGMTREGTLRSSFMLAGVRQDTEVWSVLADEWRGAASQPARPAPVVGKP